MSQPKAPKDAEAKRKGFYILRNTQTLLRQLPVLLCLSGTEWPLQNLVRLFKVALPLSRTGLFATGLMTFVANWNELMLA